MQLGSVHLQVAAEAGQGGVDQALWRPSRVDLVEDLPRRRGQGQVSRRPRTRSSNRPWTSSLATRSAPVEATSRRRTGDQVGVGRFGQPCRQPVQGVGAAEPLGHRLGTEEALLDEAAQGLAEAVLALDDDGGVRDGQAERTAEQGGHREPVRQPADHGRHRGGLDPHQPPVAPGHPTVETTKITVTAMSSPPAWRLVTRSWRARTASEADRVINARLQRRVGPPAEPVHGRRRGGH